MFASGDEAMPVKAYISIPLPMKNLLRFVDGINHNLAVVNHDDKYQRKTL